MLWNTESPDSVFMDSPKVNGSTTVHIPSNGLSSPDHGDRTPSINSIEKQQTDEKTKRHGVKRCLFENLLTLFTLLGVILGIALGIGLRSVKTWTKREVMYISFPGDIFLNMLKCLILPLIMSSLVAAVGSLDSRLAGKIGLRALAYYLATTILAIILGIILVVTVKPGESQNVNKMPDSSQQQKPTLPEDTLMDLVRNMFPENMVEAAIFQRSLELVPPKQPPLLQNATNSTGNVTTGSADDMRLWDYTIQIKHNTNILGVVVFSIVLGVTLTLMKRRGKPLLDVFVAMSDAMMLITKAVIWFTPVGVLFLVAGKILAMKDFGEALGQIGMYTATVLGGVLGHGFIVLPLIYFLLVRKNPYTFIFNMGQALATAFGTSSSSATLPVTITCLEEKNHIDPRVSRFCLPIGATMNMDGTALYEAVAAIFIAQIRGVNLNAGKIVAISITATAASIGAAGIPQAGLVTMVMVLNVIGLPAEDVAFILIVDWILDRFRTLVNVLGDSFGSAIVAHFSKHDLDELTDDVSNLEMTNL